MQDSKSEYPPQKKENMTDLLKKAISRIPEEGAEKAAAIVARSFYKEMKRSGFTNNQIIAVASEIIACMSKSLKGYKEKVGEV